MRLKQDLSPDGKYVLSRVKDACVRNFGKFYCQPRPKNLTQVLETTGCLVNSGTTGRMARCMKGNSSMEFERVEENGFQTFTVKIVINTKASTVTIKKMAAEFINGLMDQNTKECSKTT